MSLLAHKTAIRNPSAATRRLLAQHAGAVRWAYNQLVEMGKTELSSDGRVNPGDMAKLLRKAKPDWWSGVDWEMLDNGKARYENALKRWRACKRGKHTWHRARSCGSPRFHRRGQGDAITFGSHLERRVRWEDNRHPVLPTIGRITLAEQLPTVGWVKQFHCVREADKWYAVLIYEDGKPAPTPALRAGKPIVGVDVGLKALAVTSAGAVYDNPKPLVRSAKRMRRLDKAIARSRNTHGKNKPSNRRIRLYARRARLARKAANQRKATHRNIASAIAKSSGAVVVETLSLTGLFKNRRLAKGLSDAGLGGLLREISWQCAKRGVPLLCAPRNYASTQLCAQCGAKPAERIGLNVRVYKCGACGWQCDRDLNASYNLAQLGYAKLAPAYCARVKGRGGFVSPPIRAAAANEASMGVAKGNPPTEGCNATS